MTSAPFMKMSLRRGVTRALPQTGRVNMGVVDPSIGISPSMLRAAKDFAGMGKANGQIGEPRLLFGCALHKASPKLNRFNTWIAPDHFPASTAGS